MNRTQCEIILKEKFGFEKFYDEQWQTIDMLFQGKRVLLIEKTGFGKSLCFQFPATQFKGITIIFSPLIALMRDQVNALNKKGISAKFINSEQSPEQNLQVMQDAIDGKIKILYIAPERQNNDKWIEATQNMQISMVVIDEAHTISVWGHDFRPAFRRIINLVKLLPNELPVLATTATATKRVQKDIEKQISGDVITIRGNLLRDNFHLFVIETKSEDEKFLWLAENIKSIPGTGLLYSGTRVNTETYSKWFDFNNINSTYYHAGLDGEKRKEIENGLMNNKWKCIISTNALGMGIDKPNIRFIIHTQIPQSPIHYYQEIGRAGRDGKPTYIILFYNSKEDKKGIAEDYKLPKSFIEGGRPSIKKYNQTIDALKEEPLNITGLMRETNLLRTPIRVIIADLIEQEIIKEVKFGGSKNYEYQFNAPELDAKKFDELRKFKLDDLNSMIDYIYTKEPRMKFLCEYLGDEFNNKKENCDNTTYKKRHVNPKNETIEKLKMFRNQNYPILDVAPKTSKKINKDMRIAIKKINLTKYEIYKNNFLLTEINSIEDYESNKNLQIIPKLSLEELIEKHLQNKSNIIDGIASSYYGVSNVGASLHSCKYENGGDFPKFLLDKTIKAFKKQFANLHFDLLVYVPSTISGDLVKNFAIQISSKLKIPISHKLIKTHKTEPQKIFNNSLLKRENVSDVFEYAEREEIMNKNILLIDDIFDSGATIKEIGKLFTDLGAQLIAPLVIAKTVGGDIKSGK
ncbi:MAG: RecQ family ATP-dependent DNA helicase [Candidatus Marinimicrobia bacterium]|nr:RecQ family ATP-dependent DNA helicase [Candidatus Neomarinimicrobiota bacterium]